MAQAGLGVSVQISYESNAGIARSAEGLDAALFHRIVGATGVLIAAVGIVLAPYHPSFANETKVSAT